ncbi:unnamed protein product [Toxocara canis]|uniref:Proliferating cell nuclear antigen n=1 Tax=Toxocara canis TaxID=6265 RepID=A0A183V944_TOXCA|nr:unnamed protein product [Toxocara canis]
MIFIFLFMFPEELAQLDIATGEKAVCEVKKLAERLCDLEVVSNTVAGSFELSANAIVHMDVRTNEYKEIIFTSIGKVDKLCVMVNLYLETRGNIAKIEAVLDTPMGIENGLSGISSPKGNSERSTKSHETPMLSNKFREISKIQTRPRKIFSPAMKSLDTFTHLTKPYGSSATVTEQNSSLREGLLLAASNVSSSNDDQNDGDPSFAPDCTIVALGKTCFVQRVR